MTSLIATMNVRRRARQGRANHARAGPARRAGGGRRGQRRMVGLMFKAHAYLDAARPLSLRLARRSRVVCVAAARGSLTSSSGSSDATLARRLAQRAAAHRRPDQSTRPAFVLGGREGHRRARARWLNPVQALSSVLGRTWRACREEAASGLPWRPWHSIAGVQQSEGRVEASRSPCNGASDTARLWSCWGLRDCWAPMFERQSGLSAMRSAPDVVWSWLGGCARVPKGPFLSSESTNALIR